MTVILFFVKGDIEIDKKHWLLKKKKTENNDFKYILASCLEES